MTAVTSTDTTEMSDTSEGGAAQGPPWWHPAATVDRVTCAVRGVEKRLAQQPLARLTLAAPRTARFVVGELLGEDVPGVPPARLTPALVGHVAMDESIMALAIGPEPPTEV